MKLLNVIVVIDTPYDLKDAAELKVSFIIILIILARTLYLIPNMLYELMKDCKQ